MKKSEIDTDKYEGHTPAPWEAHNDWYKNGIDENNLGLVESFQLSWGVTLSEEKLSDNRENRIGHHVMHKADAQLIADAPLLLDLLIDARRMVKQLHAMLDEDDGFNWAINNIGEQEMIWWNQEATE
jgi:hypothetical protein